MLLDLASGFEFLTEYLVVLTALVGLLAGAIFVGMPDLTAAIAVAGISAMYTLTCLPFMLRVYTGAVHAGSIPAILIQTLGKVAAAEGHATVGSSDGRQALEISPYASVCSEVLATLTLIAIAAPLTFKVAPPEFTLFYTIALTIVAAVYVTEMLKGMFVLSEILLRNKAGAYVFGPNEIEPNVEGAEAESRFYKTRSKALTSLNASLQQPTLAETGCRLRLLPVQEGKLRRLLNTRVHWNGKPCLRLACMDAPTLARGSILSVFEPVQAPTSNKLPARMRTSPTPA
ncbi:tripartite tricarboxylate transporter permease [Roseobacter sp.]|uniref:tripartite tricarboxylate transporter permease n=1 Tax=Roseobacter sp. TaxID=1907202 RepID=UPI0038587D7D